MSPPFYVSFKHFARQPGKRGEGVPVYLTSEMRYQIIAAAIVMTHLYAALNNESVESVSGNNDLVAFIDYTLKFHLGAQSGQASTASVHGAFKAQYDINLYHNIQSIN